MREQETIVWAVLVCFMAMGCTSSPKEAAPEEPMDQPAAVAPEPAAAPSEPVAAKDPSVEAQEIFQARCVTCHGANGKGDGAASAALNPKPRDYTSPEWQKSVTDDHIAKVIVGGGGAVGLSALMPANPDLADQPEVVDALVALVRNLGNNN
ncbi:MAG: cytochrome c [Myxococcota bacterium]